MRLEPRDVCTRADATAERFVEARRRLGRDLHDELGQHLTGLALLSQSLERRLVARGVPEADDARRLVSLANEAIDRTRRLACSLMPPPVASASSAATALRRIAREIEAVLGIRCRLERDHPIELDTAEAVTHLCQIAREAAHNAFRHGAARSVRLSLFASGVTGILVIEDDGTGFGDRPNALGLGIRIMRGRAEAIGGGLTIDPGPGPTVVTCRFPMRPSATRTGTEP